MSCPHCQSQSVVKNGTYGLQDGSRVQHYRCKECGKRLREKTGTPMSRLRTPTTTVSIALKMRGEGMGVRASSRILDVSHSTILPWENRVAQQAQQWSPPAPEESDVTLEHDELDTRVENRPLQ